MTESEIIELEKRVCRRLGIAPMHWKLSECIVIPIYHRVARDWSAFGLVIEKLESRRSIRWRAKFYMRDSDYCVDIGVEEEFDERCIAMGSGATLPLALCLAVDDMPPTDPIDAVEERKAIERAEVRIGSGKPEPLTEEVEF